MIFRQTLSFFNLGMQKRLLYAPYHITHTCKRVWKCTAMREEICMFYDSQTSFILNFRMPCLVRREFLYISCYFLFINRVLEEIIAVPEFSAIFFRRMRPWNRRKATLWLPLYSLVRPFVCVSQCVCVCATCASCRQVLGPLSPSGSFQLSLLKTLHSQEPLKILRSFHVAHIRRDPFSAHVCVCVSPDVSVVSSPACKISEIPCSCLRPFLAGVSEVSTIWFCKCCTTLLLRFLLRLRAIYFLFSCFFFWFFVGSPSCC